MDLPQAWVEGVVSFYTMYWRRPMGRSHIAVCTNLSCYLRGAEQIYDAVCKRTGIQAGQVSADGKFSIERAECLGSCDTAPMLQLNNDGYYENLTVEGVLELVGKLERDGVAPPPTAHKGGASAPPAQTKKA
jgi:NADH:ubiquinone oxidoreductase subunit E